MAATRTIFSLFLLAAILGQHDACAFTREQAAVMLQKIRIAYPDLLAQQGYGNLPNYGGQYGNQQTLPNYGQYGNQQTLPNYGQNVNPQTLPNYNQNLNPQTLPINNG